VVTSPGGCYYSDRCCGRPRPRPTYLKLVFHTERSTLVSVITDSAMQRRRGQTSTNSTILGLSDISTGSGSWVRLGMDEEVLAGGAGGG